MKQRASSPFADFFSFVIRHSSFVIRSRQVGISAALRHSASPPLPFPPSPPPGLLARAQSRYIRSRPGSVLILVVALLVLMALIGTAFMSMAQTDRATAVQHENNTEIDLLLDGIISLVKATVVNDLQANGQFRPGLNYNTDLQNTFNNSTGLGLDIGPATAIGEHVGTPWLASRVPEATNETDASPVGGTPWDGNANIANPPMWRFMSQWIIGAQYNSPIQPTNPGNGIPTFTTPSGTPNDIFIPPYAYNQRTKMYPTITPGGMPGFTDNPFVPPPQQHIVVAADTDGDGIADAGLVKLPMGSINGVTYYAAVRMVDNSAAVNANIAWEHNPLTTATATPPQLPGDFFPSNIDLLDLLVGTDLSNPAPGPGLARMLDRRMGLNLSNNPPLITSAAGAYDDSDPQSHTVAARLLPRNDFAFSSAAEAEWMQMGRRLKYPSFWLPPNVGTTPCLFSPLTINESLTLARSFVISNAAVTGGSIIEQDLPFSLALTSNPSFPVPTSPYSPDQAVPWYQSNFAFLQRSYATNGGVNVVPIRSILTTDNAVSNYSPTKLNIPASGQNIYVPGAQYQFGDVVTFADGITNLPHHYVCINPSHTGPLAGSSPIAPGPLSSSPSYFDQTSRNFAWQFDNDTWVYQPWTTGPTKTPINTASFGQLWLAYCQVMADQQRTNPPLPSGSLAWSWAPAYPADWNTSIPPVAAVHETGRMFRNPIRQSPTKASNSSLTSSQILQLRAAISAVNAIDFRDTDDDVTSRTVHLIDGTNPFMPDVVATVYGLERQPFITQVYCTNAQYQDPVTSAPINGYVAIEIYNPYNVDIDLTNYTLATMHRPDTPTTQPPDLSFTFIPWTGGAPGTPPVIKAQTSIVIVSNGSPPPGLTFDPTKVAQAPLPANSTATPLYIVTGLATGPVPAFMDNELYLFRGRRDGGGLPGVMAQSSPTGGVPTGPTALPQSGAASGLWGNTLYTSYNEGTVTTPNPADMVPVDSYDFDGFTALPTPTDPPTEWYYVRPRPPTGIAVGAAVNKYWHFVYPGHYVINVPGTTATTAPTTELPRLADGTVTSPSGGSVTAGEVFINNNALNLTATGGYTPGTIPLGDSRFVSAVANANYRDVPLEVNNVDFGGPNGPRTGTPGGKGFPFGGFARNGDMLEVPYIGSYRLAIVRGGGPSGPLQIIEMNPVTMDSVMALGLSQSAWGEANDTVATLPIASIPNGNNPLVNSTGTIAIEQIGRFCPLSQVQFTGTTYVNPPDDFLPPNALSLTNDVTNTRWLYHWTTRLFDYLTVQSPQQDYLPDVDPSQSDGQTAGPTPRATPFPTFPYKYVQALAIGTNEVAPVPNQSNTILNGEPGNIGATNEETVPVQGLININTAPWRVLAAVPWVPTNFTARLQANADIALSIVYYRDVNDSSGATPTHGHGPFKSIFELNDVPIFTPITGPTFVAGGRFRDIMPITPPNDSTKGYLSPAYSALGDPVAGDFKANYLMINRVSNLITTRSDSFTAYILLQGWRNAESTDPTSPPTLAVQRRAAFLIDRSGVTQINNSPTITFVPNQ